MASLVGSPLEGQGLPPPVAHRLPYIEPNLPTADARRGSLLPDSYLGKMQESRAVSFPRFDHSWPLVLL